MGTIPLTDELRAEYERLFSEAAIPDGKEPEVAAAVQKILDHWPRYETVAATLNIPPHPVALIHAMESGCDFSTHLHNGDPLTARTVHEPAGRPVAGEPPFTWEASAMDALRQHGLDVWKDWSIAGLCYVLERYNGWGYRKYHSETKSPYLWSYTSIYTSGKYVADGKWSATAVSRQVGAMALLLALTRLGKAFPVEVEDALVAETPTQSVASVVPAVGLRNEQAPSPVVGGEGGKVLSDNGALTLGGIPLSKKLCAFIGGGLFILFAPSIGFHVTPEQQKAFTDALMAYLVSQGAADFGAPLVALLRKYAENNNA